MRRPPCRARASRSCTRARPPRHAPADSRRRTPTRRRAAGRSGACTTRGGTFLREWYMHPNGQLPAYEWVFGDVNPPVHAWAAWRVYKIEKRVSGKADRAFLERVFHKLLLNFTWWVNRKDAEGRSEEHTSELQSLR